MTSDRRREIIEKLKREAMSWDIDMLREYVRCTYGNKLNEMEDDELEKEYRAAFGTEHGGKP